MHLRALNERCLRRQIAPISPSLHLTAVHGSIGGTAPGTAVLMQWVLSKPSGPGVVPWLTCPSIGVSRPGSWSADRLADNQLFPVSAAAAAAKSLQSCPILSDPMDCSLPGSPIPGIFQARALEWAAIAFSFQCLLHIMCCSVRCLFDPFRNSHFTDVITEAQSQGVTQVQLGCEPRSGFLVSSVHPRTWGAGLRGVRGVGGGGSLWGLHQSPRGFRVRALEPMSGATSKV